MIDGAKLQAWWALRQGLDGSLQGARPAEVLERTGWARTVGGVGPYLTLFSRAGTSREAADAAMAKLEIHELPAARGCTYLVPAPDFVLALSAGAGFDSEIRKAETLGVKAKEIDTLCRKVVDALAEGPKEPEEIRAAVGSAVRSLGEAGKKKGLTTTLPVALGKLQTEGEIRRVPVNGRLDQQRYRYALWRPNPLAKRSLSKEETSVELARRYFRWIGPASLEEYQGFSALGVKAAKAAVAPLGLVPLPGDGGRLLFPEDLDALQSFAAPKVPSYALVSSIDGITLLRRDVKGLLGREDLGRKLSPALSPGALGGLVDLPSHAIIDRGQLIGLWEYDTETAAIVWITFGVKDKVLAQVVAKTEAFVRDQLGDARSFSLDSPKSRAPRIAALRKSR